MPPSADEAELELELATGGSVELRLALTDAEFDEVEEVATADDEDGSVDIANNQAKKELRGKQSEQSSE